jgi:hypothetical protein
MVSDDYVTQTVAEDLSTNEDNLKFLVSCTCNNKICINVMIFPMLSPIDDSKYRYFGKRFTRNSPFLAEKWKQNLKNSDHSINPLFFRKGCEIHMYIHMYILEKVDS